MQRKNEEWKSAAARRIRQFAGDVTTVEAAVRLVAKRLLHDIICPPTDLQTLAHRLNVKRAEPVAGLPISGELRPDEDGFVIVYSASMSEGRKRFTIAHELGHAVFEQTGPNCPRHGRELEKMCDMLASEFLMPYDVFHDRVGRSIGPPEVFQLAREFGTSMAATAVRCRQFLGVSLFQIKDTEFEWGVGTIRRQCDLIANIDALRKPMRTAMEGVDGEENVYLRNGDQKLQWTCLRGQGRALFVLQPSSSVRAQIRNRCNPNWSI